MPFYEVQGKRPQIGATSYVHPTAVIIGDVVIGEGCWIGPHVTMRADEGAIRMGDYSNLQDNSVIHGREVVLGKYSHLGHACVIHGATLGEHVLVVQEGRAAVAAIRRPAAPADVAIVGIVDCVDMPPSTARAGSVRRGRQP